MVIVDCPWCEQAVALGDGETELVCEGCSIRVEIATEEISEIARAA